MLCAPSPGYADYSPEDLGRCPSSCSLALMWPPEVEDGNKMLNSIAARASWKQHRNAVSQLREESKEQ